MSLPHTRTVRKDSRPQQSRWTPSPDANPDDILPSLSDQCYEVANQIQAFRLARGHDVGLTAAQWHALQGFRMAYDGLEARIALNKRIATTLYDHQAQLEAELATRPALVHGTAWLRYRAASDAFGVRLVDATRAESEALHRRYLDFLRGVLVQLEGEVATKKMPPAGTGSTVQLACEKHAVHFRDI